MKYSIFDYDQERALQYVKVIESKNGKPKEIRLDVTDLLILRDMADFMNRRKVIKYTIDDKTYFSVQYQVLIDDLPILNIKKQALSDRVEKLTILGLLEKQTIKTQCGSFTAFRLTEEYENLIYSCTSSELHSHEYSTTSAKVVDYAPKDSTTYNSATLFKEKDIKESAEPSVSAAQEPQEEEKKERLQLFHNCFPGCDNGDYTEVEKLFSAKIYEGIDLIYYINAVSDWSDQKNLKRTRRGWYSTIRTFMRKDNDAGKLKMINNQGKDTFDYEGAMAYLNEDF